MRVRSTTRARRLLVPSARTEEALVRMAGATMAVNTAKGLPTTLDCTAEPFLWLMSATDLPAISRICERSIAREQIRLTRADKQVPKPEQEPRSARASPLGQWQRLRVSPSSLLCFGIGLALYSPQKSHDALLPKV